ncbi:galactose mutarotase [Mumia zhuanghuii]|uniref:Galactose mutarotase n=2 Tax=Mumia TaxID=1546255 RepID=A0ABW1QL20_9ACTN|nr:MULTISPECIES: galactose mutarotase [Mumia]KAA1424966.1 galactose mutarotase [Mumia zhuanghuii]
MISLASGSWTATIDPYGAGLASLRRDGRDVVVPRVAGDGGFPFYRGAVLAPWPNRLEDGAYDFGGRSHQVPVNEPEGGTALHGLVVERAWTVVDQRGDAVRLTVDVPRSDGYPYAVRLDLAYQLGPDGLASELVATNDGAEPAPYGCGVHPYLVLDEGEATEVELGAGRYLESSPDRKLPVGLHDVDGSAYDFRVPRPLDGAELDTPYTDLVRSDDGVVTVRVGRTVLRGTEGVRWIQVYTPVGRGSLAVEPCSSPANAFRTGQDLVVLAPGEQHTLAWTLSRPPLVA